MAWLVDVANCSHDNRKYREKYDLIFDEYKSSMQQLKLLIAMHGERIEKKGEEHSFEEWLKIITGPHDMADGFAYRERNFTYRAVTNFSKKLRNMIGVIHAQYPTLVGLEMVKQEGLLDYLEKQAALCDTIQQYSAMDEFDITTCELVNECLIDLLHSNETFFEGVVNSKKYKYSRPA